MKVYRTKIYGWPDHQSRMRIEQHLELSESAYQGQCYYDISAYKFRKWDERLPDEWVGTVVATRLREVISLRAYLSHFIFSGGTYVLF
jgi:hypothetical protein